MSRCRSCDKISVVITMEELRSVVNLGSYGRIVVRLKEMIEERGLTRYRLAKLADTRFEVVDKWCSGSVERIDADVLARFCYILNCDITDIIQYDV